MRERILTPKAWISCTDMLSPQSESANGHCSGELYSKKCDVFSTAHLSTEQPRTFHFAKMAICRCSKTLWASFHLLPDGAQKAEVYYNAHCLGCSWGWISSVKFHTFSGEDPKFWKVATCSQITQTQWLKFLLLNYFHLTACFSCSNGFMLFNIMTTTHSSQKKVKCIPRFCRRISHDIHFLTTPKTQKLSSHPKHTDLIQTCF